VLGGTAHDESLEETPYTETVTKVRIPIDFSVPD